MISLILPTYNDANNIKLSVPKYFQVLKDENIKTEIVIVDDNSPDGTASSALELADRYPVRVHIRKDERGLATAAIKGLELARGNVCVVMDADLNFPAEKLPDMIKPILDDKCDATFGSRGTTGEVRESRPLLRMIINKGAGFLTKGITTLSDPANGFMAIRKSIIDTTKLDPIGRGIVLELIVKTNPRLLEIPVSMDDREKGESKVGFKDQIDYIRHLWRLYCYKYSAIAQFYKFCLVGSSGVFVDTACLVGLVELLSLDPRLAAAFVFFIAVSWNYYFNRIWTFDSGRGTKISYSYPSFVTVSLMGLGIRIVIMHLLIEYAEMGERPWYILASFLGIIGATIFNFLGSKYIAFSKLFPHN